ncbi:MAG: [FeFe] hydrogenase H-cluster radical SAM maturase HydG [Planctomycetota bacterium]|nr:[FeFe] hydrogenase H-cluster radical SAM maturase HydG [Planctomycetota bacterium]
MLNDHFTIDDPLLQRILARTARPTESSVRKVLRRAKAMNGLSVEEVGILVNTDSPRLQRSILSTAARVKRDIYGERLVFFAPLYVSDYCVNDCEYCNFHSRNRQMRRRRLPLAEVADQVKFLIGQGHKRILLECGEHPRRNTVDYVSAVIRKIYSVRTPKGNIRRVNVNIAATTVKNYRRLKTANIGTYQLFQETYHRPTYERLHHGPKADYDRQLTAHCRALSAGLDDVGIGVLFGLYDWRYEVLALVAHARHLDTIHKVGPHTISVPRFCPAPSVSFRPEYPVSDRNFLKLIAVLRLAVPYTGMIISTRESPQIRKQAFRIGISQSSAGSVTTTGGYGKRVSQPQFSIHDTRSLHDIIGEVIKDKLVPSFCTACYRSGRTGERFMSLSKPGEIKKLCRPNALLTFAEYLHDFAADGVFGRGMKVIEEYLGRIEKAGVRTETKRRLDRIAAGERDLFF